MDAGFKRFQVSVFRCQTTKDRWQKQEGAQVLVAGHWFLAATDFGELSRVEGCPTLRFASVICLLFPDT
jgi:hypothetical protein